ncbi:adrenocortical dysplasia protein homolog [Festucalex cinctus]
MPRIIRGALTPWIEGLIQSYGSEEGSSNVGRLKAHVTSVGQMSLSQARNVEGPTGLIFLSDSVMQIPAILTSSAWEHLQEQEERECFTSLLNTTVCIRNYCLQFHMATEPTKCRFFLSVGAMQSLAAGPTKDRTPCCTTSRSVQQIIYKTWKALSGQETQDSQMNPNDFNLSDLLGEWQHDSLQTVLEDVKEKLTIARSANLQPSTSNGLPSPTQPDMFTPTSWDTERVLDDGVGNFSIPIECLLIPQGHAMHEQKENSDTLTTDGGLELNLRLSESTRLSLDPADLQNATFTDGGGEVQNCGENVTHHDNGSVHLPNKDITPLEKPWEMFAAPNDFSSSDMSQEAVPIQSMQSHQQNSHVNTSTELPITSTQREDHNKGDLGSLPPYQNQPLSSGSSNTATSSCHTAPEETQTMLENADTQQETVDRQHRKAKRKRDPVCVQEAQTTIGVAQDEAQLDGSPPSWLFDSVMASGNVEGSIHVQSLSAKRRKPLTVHADGEPFSYTYVVSGQNLLDISRFQVAKSLLPWAIKYLVVPKGTMHPSPTEQDPG